MLQLSLLGITAGRHDYTIMCTYVRWRGGARVAGMSVPRTLGAAQGPLSMAGNWNRNWRQIIRYRVICSPYAMGRPVNDDPTSEPLPGSATDDFTFSHTPPMYGSIVFVILGVLSAFLISHISTPLTYPNLVIVHEDLFTVMPSHANMEVLGRGFQGLDSLVWVSADEDKTTSPKGYVLRAPPPSLCGVTGRAQTCDEVQGVAERQHEDGWQAVRIRCCDQYNLPVERGHSDGASSTGRVHRTARQGFA